MSERTPGSGTSSAVSVSNKLLTDQLALIVEHSLNEIYIFDVNSLKFQTVNQKARENLGYSMEELCNLTPLDLKPALSRAVWDRLTGRLRKQKYQTTQFSNRHQRKDGSFYPVFVRLELISGEGTELYVAIIEDLTERAIAAESLQESEALLRSVIETAPDPIITIDEAGIVQSFSPAAERLFGYEAGEVVGNNVSMLMPTPYLEAHDSYLDRYLTTGEKHIIGIGREVTAVRKDGVVFPMELAVGELKQGDRRIFTGFIRDISERIAAEQRANELQRELAHVSRLTAMGEMSTTLAHELNQPLAAISNYAQAVRRMLEMESPSLEKSLNFTTKIAEQAQRAGDIIRQLRKFVARGETETTQEDINQVVRDAARLGLIGAATKGIVLGYNLNDSLPRVPIDKTQIQQVVVNLVRNAFDAICEEIDKGTYASAQMGRHDSNINVESNFFPGGKIIVSVSDNGPGITPEVMETLFDPFVSSKDDGMGIGLSVCRTIVEAHGGELWAKNRALGGAAFFFTLPIPGLGKD
jgi:two-component system sensor kinase FixL